MVATTIVLTEFAVISRKPYFMNCSLLVVGNYYNFYFCFQIFDIICCMIVRDFVSFFSCITSVSSPSFLGVRFMLLWVSHIDLSSQSHRFLHYEFELFIDCFLLFYLFTLSKSFCLVVAFSNQLYEQHAWTKSMYESSYNHIVISNWALNGDPFEIGQVQFFLPYDEKLVWCGFWSGTCIVS